MSHGTTREVKKIEKFFPSLFIPSFPPVHDRGPPRPKLFFSSKKLKWSRKIGGNREMSSPGVGKVTKGVLSWTKDYHTVVATMDTDKILRNTLTDASHTQKGDTKLACFAD
jgi:hypothetical protein